MSYKLSFKRKIDLPRFSSYHYGGRNLDRQITRRLKYFIKKKKIKGPGARLGLPAHMPKLFFRDFLKYFLYSLFWCIIDLRKKIY